MLLAVAVPKFRLEICPHSPFLSGFDRSHCGTKKSGLVAAVPVGVQDRFTLIAPDNYRSDFLEVKLWDKRGQELAVESLYVDEDGDEDDGDDDSEDDEQA